MNTNISIPRRMARLPRDARGYPIPVIVLRDRQGKPHFAINDHKTIRRIVQENRCHICGQYLTGHPARPHSEPRMWFVGGIRSAYHPDGAYNDGPLHHECMRYAMQVCPYLALRSWTGEIKDKSLRPDPQVRRLMVETTMIPDRPEVFVCVCVSTYTYKMLTSGWYGFNIKHQPYLETEYWRHGQQVTPEAAHPLIMQTLTETLPELKPARHYVRS